MIRSTLSTSRGKGDIFEPPGIQTLGRLCVRARPLSPYRQTSGKTASTVGVNAPQADDIILRLTAQISLQCHVGQMGGESIDLWLGELLQFGRPVDGHAIAQATCRFRPNSVKVRQGYMDDLFVRKVDPEQVEHGAEDWEKEDEAKDRGRE